MPDDSAFDAFQPYYDILVDWDARLSREAPFFQRVFANVGARRILDCACGTGHHVRLFARWGMDATGTDLSPAMVEQARADALAVGSTARFDVADFRDLPGRFDRPFDAVICTGNSLPQAGSMDAVREAIRSMAGVLRPDGVLVLHTLNFAVIPEGVNHFEPPRVRQVEDRELVFLKLFRRTRRTCDISIVALVKQAGEWSKVETHTRAWAAEQPDLETLAQQEGLGRLQWYGGYEPRPFDPATSRDIILVCRKEKA